MPRSVAAHFFGICYDDEDMTAGTRRASAKDGENGVPINVSILTPGLYVVAFRNSKGVVVRKFVKL